MSVSIYAFSSWIGLWNRLVTPLIDDREGMDVGGEGKSADEENGGREWFPWRLWQLMEGRKLVCDCVLYYVLSKNKKGSE